MTVVHSVIGTVKPDRYEDFLSQSLEAAKLLERHGAKDVRLAGALVAGEAQGTFVFSSEYDDPEAYGAFADELYTDSEMLSLLSRLRSADNPVVITQQSLSIVLPVHTPKKGRGTIIEVHASRPAPGRLEQGLALAAKACSFAQAHGAVNARVCQIGMGGSGAGLYYLSWEFKTQRAAGKCANAWMTEPKGLAIAATAASADAPSTMVFSATYQEIPL
jgi:hypothetical protein